MVVWSGDLDPVVSKLEREFTAPKKSFVLPSSNIGIGANTWIPLSNFENFPTLLEFFHIAASPTRTGVGDGVVPINTIGELLAGLKRLGQVNPHHGVDNPV